MAALLEMVLRDTGFNNLDQTDIAEYFGLYVPPDYTGKVEKITVTANKELHGIVIHKNGLNDFFNHYNINLHEDYVPISVINEWGFSDHISEVLKKEQYVICGFDNGMLRTKKINNVGHVSLISELHEDSITIIDPGPDNAGSTTVDLDDLYLAIKAKKDGLWLISKK